MFLTLQGLGLAASGPRARCWGRSTRSATQRGRASAPFRAHGRSAMPASSRQHDHLQPGAARTRLAHHFWLGALPAVALLWVRTAGEEAPARPRRGGGPHARYWPGVKPGAKPGGAARAVPPRPPPRHARVGAALGRRHRRRAFHLAADLSRAGAPSHVMGIAAYMGIQVVGGLRGLHQCRLRARRAGPAPRPRAVRARQRAVAWASWCCPSAPPAGCSPSASLGFLARLFSGLAVYLAELYPTELRGAGRGLRLQHRPRHRRGAGRDRRRGGAVRAERRAGAARPPATLCSPLFLPETRGKPLSGKAIRTRTSPHRRKRAHDRRYFGRV